MKNPINSLRISVSFIVAITALFVMIAMAFAQSKTNVYLQPVESAEGTYVVDVMVENVTDMYGAEFHLTFNPAVFSVQDENPNQEGVQIAQGTLLPSDKGFAVANKVEETEGTITFAMTLLNPAPAVDGSGPLARVTFNVLSATPSTINIERAKLVALDLQTIPNTVIPLNIEAQTANAGQPAVAQPVEQVVEQTTAATPQNESSFPWWIVAAAIIILGILGLGVFVLMTGLSQPKKNQPQQIQTKQQKPQPRKAQPANTTQPHTARTRPSAFNK